MYQQDQGSGLIMAVLVAGGLACLGLGWWLFKKYRDDRPEDQQGFRDFGLGPRGLLAFGGIALMLFGGALALVGLFLPAILR